ncbi:MAG: DinB family protein, partial [Dehalococcoidia bacterium]
VDYVPEHRMNWTPRENLWNFRGIMLHIAAGRERWLSDAVKDGEDNIDVWKTVRSKDEIKDAYRTTWRRIDRFLSEPSRLDAAHETWYGETLSGHKIAYHMLEHDIHHRADIFNYLALLGIETPPVGT